MRPALIVAAVLAIAPAASAQDLAKQVLGSWSCTADFGYEVETWTIDYLAGGKFLSVPQHGPKVKMYNVPYDTRATIEGEWSVDGGKLVEARKRYIDISVMRLGKKVPIDMPIAIEGTLEGQKVVSGVVFKPDSFVATAGDGIVTTCKRKSDP